MPEDMLWEGNSFDEISKQTHVDEDQIKNDLARKRVEDEVIGLIKDGSNREEIQEQTKLPFAYIDSLLENPNEDRIYRFALQEEESSTDVVETGTLSKNVSATDFAADSGPVPNLN